MMRLMAIATCGVLTSSALAGGDVVPGDGPADAGLIPALPFSAAGDTSPFTDQFDVACPFTGSIAPDAWYRYESPSDRLVTIRLCESAYDTKTYVLDASLRVVGCNDDACSDSAGNPFRSQLEVIALAGQPLYIVVDGYEEDAGPYELIIEDGPVPPPCADECPPGGRPEGEPCAPGTPDVFNTGCNATPPLFQAVECGDVLCGTAWALGGTRDTDWFEMIVTDDATLSLEFTAEFDAAVQGISQEGITCEALTIFESVILGACESGTLSLSTPSAPGETAWWIIVPSAFDSLPCGEPGTVQGNEYIATWRCTTPAPPPCPTLGDANGDGFVDFDDLLVVLANFGPCP